MPNTHSILGASSSHRWLACPGSIRMSEGIPKTTSIYAQEGTAAHTLAEMCLRNGKTAAHRIGTIIINNDGSTHTVTEAMAEAVDQYVELVKAEYAAAGKGAVLLYEQKFKLDWLYPGLFGTNDAMVGEPFGTLKVYDYKHGAGVAVDAEDNTQAMYYGLGAIKDKATAAGYEDVELVIVQPRAHHALGPVRRHKLSVDELLKWGQEVLLPGAKATEDPNAPLAAGEHCRFCPALAICPEQKKNAVAVAQTVFAPVPTAPPPPEALTYTELKKILDASDMVEAWLSACRSHVRNLLETGMAKAEDLGYKLIKGRATRKWTDEKAAEEWLTAMLEDDAYVPRKLVSPAQAEKVLKGAEAKKAIKGMVEEHRGTQLAPLSDSREAVQPAIAAFTEVSDI